MIVLVDFLVVAQVMVEVRDMRGVNHKEHKDLKVRVDRSQIRPSPFDLTMRIF
jgi:hypothetical protein